MEPLKEPLPLNGGRCAVGSPRNTAFSAGAGDRRPRRRTFCWLPAPGEAADAAAAAAGYRWGPWRPWYRYDVWPCPGCAPPAPVPSETALLTLLLRDRSPGDRWDIRAGLRTVSSLLQWRRE
jgi:hypothetical protein